MASYVSSGSTIWFSSRMHAASRLILRCEKSGSTTETLRKSLMCCCIRKNENLILNGLATGNSSCTLAVSDTILERALSDMRTAFSNSYAWIEISPWALGLIRRDLPFARRSPRYPTSPLERRTAKESPVRQDLDVQKPCQYCHRLRTWGKL
jgi:hypothetical protein